nr:unnamed protein product [Callosobruchus analis]
MGRNQMIRWAVRL